MVPLKHRKRTPNLSLEDHPKLAQSPKAGAWYQNEKYDKGRNGGRHKINGKAFT